MCSAQSDREIKASPLKKQKLANNDTVILPNEQQWDVLYPIDIDTFWRRLLLLHNNWQLHSSTYWNGCASILILCGKSGEAGYLRNNKLHIWLFGYELLSTAIIITKTNIYICAGRRTLQCLKQLKPNNMNNIFIKFIQKNKTDGYSANYKELTSILQAAGNSVGLIREPMKGFSERFVLSITNPDKFNIVTYSEALSDLMMIKDKDEIFIMQQISTFTSQALKYSQTMIERLIAKNKTKKHTEICDDLCNIVENPGIIKSKLMNTDLDICYDPIIQSGGEYKLRPSAESNKDELHYNYGSIVIMMGFCLRDYCSNMARTFLVDTSSEQQEIYEILLTVFYAGLYTLRHDIELNQVYQKCISMIQNSTRPYLEEYFLKCIGWGIGLEFRDKNYKINQSNMAVCKSGMVFNFQVGFANLIDAQKETNGLEKAKKYSLLIADTVLITKNGAKILTKFDRNFFEYHLDGKIDDIDDCKRDWKYDGIEWIELLVIGYTKYIEKIYKLSYGIPAGIKRLIGLYYLQKRFCKKLDCNNCELECCGDCYITDQCAQCHDEFCIKCSLVIPDYWNDGCVCNGCYDDRIIECNRCNGKCGLWYASNRVLCGADGVDFVMEKCFHKDCDVFVCFRCQDIERNGRLICCKGQSNCQCEEVFCNQHIYENEDWLCDSCS